MKTRIAAFIFLVIFAALSLVVVALWSRKMSSQTDVAQIDRALYFVHTWVITFVVSSVAAVFVLINMIMYKRRQYEHADD